VSEIHHWTRGLTLFNRELSAPALTRPDRDALWAGASLLVPIGFASIETRRPEEAWPLGPSADGLPDWAKMGSGKLAIWNICKPEEQGSLFSTIFTWIRAMERSLEWAPPLLLELCGLENGLKNDPPPMAASCDFDNLIEGSPYADIILSLFRAPDAQDAATVLTAFYSVNHALQREFGRLLAARDVAALVIMAYWFSQASASQWWLVRRSFLEGQATILYLEKHAAGDARVMQLLQEPRRVLFRNSS
jgi:hypothetical protein